MHVAYDAFLRQLHGTCGTCDHILMAPSFADALINISNHLKGLGFADSPDYGYIRECLAQLPQPQSQPYTLAPQPGMIKEEAGLPWGGASAATNMMGPAMVIGSMQVRQRTGYMCMVCVSHLW